ncbi:conserved hypothetical protein [Ricinus communis]|uniref:Uncharacterized protein n=1 Tax=Ricinus communis TaxID=3988 RepID=B9T9A4_RICCO|nr:conserved hypothetical protein [Ricinus communis]
MSTRTKKYKQNSLRRSEAGVEAYCADSKLYDPASGDDSSSEEEVISAPGRDKGPEKPKKEGRPDFSNYGLIAKKIMPKMGYDLENPVGLKNGKGIKEKGLDEGTKADIRRRGGSQLSDVRPGVHPRLWNERWVGI